MPAPTTTTSTTSTRAATSTSSIPRVWSHPRGGGAPGAGRSATATMPRMGHVAGPPTGMRADMDGPEPVEEPADLAVAGAAYGVEIDMDAMARLLEEHAGLFEP